MRTMDLLALLLGVIFPLVSGYLTKWTMNGLKRVSTLVDNLPVAAKRAVVVLIASLITFVFSFFGVVVTGTSFDALTEPNIQALLSAAFAMLFHDGNKLAQVKVVGGVVMANDFRTGVDARSSSSRTGRAALSPLAWAVIFIALIAISIVLFNVLN